MRLSSFFTILSFLLLAANIALSQINTFPTTESFEQAFSTGSNVAFINNWTGNEVRSTSRIFNGSDSRTGTASLNVIPTSSFTGEMLISLDFTSNNNPLLSFYAYSKQNGSVTSTRPALLSFATSLDGGGSYLDDVQIGDAATFPNDNTTSYTKYEYQPPAQAASQANVIIKVRISRGDGSGSAAEWVLDDFLVEQQISPLAINSISVTANNSVTVQFNQAVNQASAEDIAHYAINNGISVQSAALTSTNEVTLTTSSMSNANYQITVNGVLDAASGTPSNNLSGSYTYVNPLSISITNVLSENSIEITFNQDLDEPSAEALLNYSVNNGIGNPTSAIRDDMDLKKVLLVFGNDFTSQNYAITVDGVRDVSTLANTTNLVTVFDYLSLEITSLLVLSNTALQVQFNQEVNTSAANLASNYNLNFGYGSPISAVSDGAGLSKVLLTFATALANNTYTLTANNVTNESGNAIGLNKQFSVANAVQTMYRNIVINEVFADPTGSAQPDPQTLPSGSSDEFIEILNIGSQAVDLNDFNLSGGSLGAFILEPNAHVILTSTSNITDFQSFGNVVGVTSWNALTNAGEQVILRDNLGNVVDSLSYDLTWYADNAKSDGGWSLEQIDPEKICSDAANWRASSSVNGATPGFSNTVFDNSPDTQRPNLNRRIVNSSQQVTM
ncbi:MAG: hypothetical protein ACJAR3_001538, partial [Roseivirga sp.]